LTQTSAEQSNDMRAPSILALGFMPAGIIAQDIFEPADFNVTEALLANGVDVPALPGLSDLRARSVVDGCSVTVSDYLQFDLSSDRGLIEISTNYGSATHSSSSLATKKSRRGKSLATML
jgi:hypothetical protein